jgi:poly(A) polymerase/tRNA nucleotidyltransferase (CCA-adding enzyme)
MLKLQIPKEEQQAIRNIVSTFTSRGFECYLVGGTVRDFILGRANYDYDFATNARPDDVMSLFKRVIPTGIKHGTVSVLFNNHMFEITTYRSDGKYIDGRHPESVHFSTSLKEDVCRRDFTINGLAYDVERDEVLDYVDGIADINRKIIRTIGEPLERFSEDGLRTYRACRFAARLDFIIEERTFDAILKTHHIAQLVSIERIRDEFNKLLETGRPSAGIEYMRNSGLLDLFLPELSQCYGVTQNRYHIHDVYYHSLYSCDAAPADNIKIRLAALLHDIGKVSTKRAGEDGDSTFYNHEVIGAKMVRKIMKRMKYSNDDCDKVNNLILNHMFHYTDDWSDGAVRRFMRKAGIENIDDLISLRLADRKGNGSREGLPVPIVKLQERIAKVIEDENAITVKDLKINGNTLMEHFNLRPGPTIGKILNELLEHVLDDPDVNEPDILLSMSRDILARRDPEN